MALKLCGFAGSNYHNKVKLALLEKGIAFEEELVWTGMRDNPALTDRSPLGKVPFLQTEQGVILESALVFRAEIFAVVIVADGVCFTQFNVH